MTTAVISVYLPLGDLITEILSKLKEEEELKVTHMNVKGNRKQKTLRDDLDEIEEGLDLGQGSGALFGQKFIPPDELEVKKVSLKIEMTTVFTSNRETTKLNIS